LVFQAFAALRNHTLDTGMKEEREFKQRGLAAKEVEILSKKNGPRV
jgi:hypothetical protein